LAITIGTLIANFGLYNPYYYAESYVTVAGFSPAVKSYLLPMINGLSFVGRVLGGYAADKIGRLNVLYPMTILSGLFCLVLWLPATSINHVIAFTCLYGLGTGVLISVAAAAISQISPLDKLGARMGAYTFCLAAATLSGPAIGGAIIHQETRQAYNNLAIFTGVTLTVGGVVLFVSRLLSDKNLRRKF
jgi:MFS family permease